MSKRYLHNKYIVNNLNVQDIADELWCSFAKVYYYIVKYDIRKPKKDLSKITKKYLIDQYINKEKTYEQISKESNCCKTYIKNKMKLYGIKPRYGKYRSIEYKRTKYNNKRFIGRRFRLLKVIKYIIGKGWLCRCDCGGEVIAKQKCLTQKRRISCGCLSRRKGKDCPRWKGYKDISGHVFSKFIRNAVDRNIDFKLTIKDIYNIYIKQNKKCALSGVAIEFGVNASLDRIDSSKPYVKSNIQLLHKHLNIMKWDLSVDEFINWCKKVSNYNRRIKNGKSRKR